MAVFCEKTLGMIRCEEEIRRHCIEHPQPTPLKLTWTGTKTELIELIYALDTADCFDDGKTSLSRIASLLSDVFNIQLGSNIARNFYDMRIRNHPTPFLDRLKSLLIERMERMSR